MPIRLFAPRYWPTWLGLGLLRLLAVLPYGWLIRMGQGLGGLLRRLPFAFTHTARRNMELCLPHLDNAGRQALLVQHFHSLGIALFETAFSWWASPARVQKIIEVEGAHNLTAALARGRGVILLTAHFTTLEMGGRILASVQPTNFLYRPTENALLAWSLGRCRRRFGGHPIPRDDIRAVISALKHNECVWYAPDQSYRKKGAQMVELFGIPAATNTFTSRLARMTGATVLPYFFERLPGAQGYRAVIHPAFDNFPSESSVADTERFNHLIEAQVRKVPDQYLWIHRRFKGLSADYPDYYGRDHAQALPVTASPAATGSLPG
jgi:Kdo2-lipid IVA lauroyltransferase/acyltransferase